MKKAEKTVIELGLFQNPSWGGGYGAFAKLFGKPVGWLCVIEDGKHRLIRIDQKGHPHTSGHTTTHDKPSCSRFLEKYLPQLIDNNEEIDKLPYTYRCPYGGWGIIFALSRMGQLKGFFVLCNLRRAQKQLKPFFTPFEQFLQTHIELVYKSFELQNFYETVHPRALALSTIHSVHRVMASSVRLNDLIPRVGRLCAQVLKAQKCAVYLLDPDRHYLIPKFSFGEENGRKRRIRIGSGIEGHVAETAEFYFTRKCLAVPFIEDDVVGVVTLKDKMGDTPFTKTDLEILKTLSEQAVGAIKNAQLFEETEQLTLSSVKTIGELLALSYSGGEYVHHPVFGEITYRIGQDLGISGADLTNLHRATYLIDAGHLGTPDHILMKKDKLTQQEFDEVKQHPNRGAAILQQISSLRPLIPIILHHHERYDGKGYPNHLKGEDIPIGARIIALVDAFIAMLCERPYREGKGLNDAIKEVKRNSGSQFDPRVVESFMRVVNDVTIREQLEKISNEMEVRSNKQKVKMS
ncbi:MAG: hypothetical protein A3G33_05435 [Omnitrophica bacterium RIFCSPLOWO2_12_FULL_44_17]|uniref:HD-GYP domain-containing protein n=1 Tax=Candidatus Danuiimicrobium aquiferis TaxID=1801832 RepID=A0A1G1L0N4_9BACT|nr:MAG: hypothetical protein A3B72_04700 [Omnitrophica bacterium RIFCSPHIGHO2_02_FULL_45_28]OGW89865.1 MAG: hypothetical protein A3E74_07325 [Omnitrophica bacterium RIFCSPHIGHO2_12_FULL_44_12]OGW98716.1 MAG: hypothetical protein A3G33_05435 [Omnitrophica bacterium RIFCSPLOWO2_12_FULL_44_17]OGX03107.1 MAG: hypothetical protein A3J12_05840 [Omnitrophica bacterium RIFCSPLOWO2_02_FULL_44_11]